MDLTSHSKSPNATFWKGRRVLVTGHSGFKGGWLSIWLHLLGAKIAGVSLPPATSPNLFSLACVDKICENYFCDIRDGDAVTKIVQKFNPEIIFHLAAQPLVRVSYRQPVETFATNVLGSIHILEAARKINSVLSIVMVTTDKVYRNNEWFWPYREDDALGGYDAYSASKAASEIAIASYRSSYFESGGVGIASARAGNVIGGGDWSLDRLIPDAVRAWQSGKTLTIRNPMSIRPWQHVLDPLSGYLRLSEKLSQTSSLAGAYNFGPASNEACSVRDVVISASEAYGFGEINFLETSNGPHEAGYLALESSKSREVLGFSQVWNLECSVRKTMDWYRKQHQGVDAYQLCIADIDEYGSNS
jgi:CDP-glucose 4,6-dehydratase